MKKLLHSGGRYSDGGGGALTNLAGGNQQVAGSSPSASHHAAHARRLQSGDLLLPMVHDAASGSRFSPGGTSDVVKLKLAKVNKTI